MKTMKRSFLYFICSVSALGGLLFGYDWVVIGGAKPFYELYFGITDSPSLQGLAMTTANIGCLFGAMTAGWLTDRWGRRPLLLFAAVLFTVSAVGTGLFNDFVLFNISRFVGGIGIGIASMLSPMYIAEVSPANIRGRMVSLNQMTIVLGILFAQVINMLLAESVDPTMATAELIQTWNVRMGWRWMFWAETIPAALFLVLALFIPESPVYIAMRQGKVSADEAHQKATLLTLFGGKYGRLLLLGLVIAVFQQWCGTNVIFNYAQEIFQGAGFSVDGMFINIVITGIANVLFTFVTLYTVEKWGRRTLMLIGAGGLGMIYLILGTCYFVEVKGLLMVVLVVMAISCYAMTLGPVTWVLLAEIFPHRVRGVAMAVCTFALWTGCCTLTYTFPLMNASVGSYGSFWIYSGICIFAFIFLFRKCPETKGKALE
ncbi:MAG: sugar porter family MFS transporter [Prevotella sp.]|nr:sugar porter family MFS transporter [Prevotella sp.]